MATLSSTTNVSSLVINKVDTKTTFANMLTNNQVNENELYFIPSEIGSSSEIFGVEFNATDINIFECNKTYSEIINAIDNNYPIYAIASDSGTPIFNLNYNRDTGTENIIEFTSSIFNYDGESAYFRLLYTNSNVISTTVVPVQTQQSNATLTIGSYTYNGTTAVTIPTYTGSYNTNNG